MHLEQLSPAQGAINTMNLIAHCCSYLSHVHRHPPTENHLPHKSFQSIFQFNIEFFFSKNWTSFVTPKQSLHLSHKYRLSLFQLWKVISSLDVWCPTTSKQTPTTKLLPATRSQFLWGFRCWRWLSTPAEKDNIAGWGKLGAVGERSSYHVAEGPLWAVQQINSSDVLLGRRRRATCLRVIFTRESDSRDSFPLVS